MGGLNAIIGLLLVVPLAQAGFRQDIQFFYHFAMLKRKKKILFNVVVAVMQQKAVMFGKLSVKGTQA